MMTERPDSIRDLVTQPDRGVKETDDVNLLADYEVVYFEQDGRTKQPTYSTSRRKSKVKPRRQRPMRAKNLHRYSLPRTV